LRPNDNESGITQRLEAKVKTNGKDGNSVMRYDSTPPPKATPLRIKYIQDKIIVLCSYKACKVNCTLGRVRVVTGLP